MKTTKHNGRNIKMKTTTSKIKFLVFFKLDLDSDFTGPIDDREAAQDFIDESLNIYRGEVKRADYSIVSFCPFVPVTQKTILRKAARNA